MDRKQMMIDAHTLGVLMRNMATIVNRDAETWRKIHKIRNAILARYGSHSVAGCYKKILLMLQNG